MLRIALLDDYQGVAKQLTDWSVLPSGSEVQAFRDHVEDQATLARRLRPFDVVMAIRERTPFPRELLERLPSLKLLTTTGLVNAAIDLEAATELGVLVCGTDGYPPATVELTWGLTLALLRHIPQEDRAIRQGRWQTALGVVLHGKVLGVVGLGRIGSQVAAIGKAFQMVVIAWSQNLTPERAAQQGGARVEKEELFRRSDVVTIHLRLSDRTRGLIAARELGMMKPTAYLVNTSRGPIVDEAALIDALQRKAIAGAALDVFDREPLPPDHPLLRLDNTVLTPHLGYTTWDTLRLYYSQTVENVLGFLKGEPKRVINPDVLERRTQRR